ncbi:MAG: agmatinase [Oceanidesulfovibrio sp.]
MTRQAPNIVADQNAATDSRMSRMNAPVTLLGAPWDGSSSFARGAAGGPAAIRAALASEAGNPWTETGRNLRQILGDSGDVRLPEDSPRSAIENAVAEIIRCGQKPIILGGDHSITYPAVRAVAAACETLTLVHVDAHPDIHDAFEGDPYSHASPFARIMEEFGHIRLVQVGVREATPHQREQAERFGAEWLEMKDHARWKRIETSGPVYVSCDLDGLDPAFAPGVSHPSPGGMSTRQLLDMLHGLAADAEIVGADVVELNPTRDFLGLTAQTAAKITAELAGLMA